MADERIPDETDTQAPVDAPAPAPPSPPPAPPPPAAPPVPRLLEGSAGRRPYRVPPGVAVNVGDMLGRIGDVACPAWSWPRTGDAVRDRTAFAAALLGVSASAFHPRKTPQPSGEPPLQLDAGGSWWFPVRGEAVAKGNYVGPAIDAKTGAMLSNELEVVPEDQAVGTVVGAEDDGWRVKLFAAPGGP